jgi:hypothetical protein
MEYFLIWILSFVSILCFDEIELLNRFEYELNNYFYNNLSSFISERDSLLPLLDFPNGLISKLTSVATPIKLQFYVSDVTLYDFKQRLKEINYSEASDTDFLHKGISKFCCDFKNTYELPSFSGVKTSSMPESLLFSIDVDFISFYSKSSCLNSDVSHRHDYNKFEWDFLFSNLSEIKERAYDFLIECMFQRCFHIYSDYYLLLNSIQNSFEIAAASVETIYKVDDALLFFGQVSGCYFGSRRKELLKLPNGEELSEFFISKFSYSIDVLLIDAIEEIEKMYETENNMKEINEGWNVMAQRVSVCQILFIQSPHTLITNTVFKTVEQIIHFCNFKQENQAPLDLDNLKRFTNDTIIRFLETNELSILENTKFFTLYEYFKELLNLAFDRTVSIENLHKFSNTFIASIYNIENCEKLIEVFMIVSDKLPEFWFDSRLLNEDYEVYHHFTNAIYSFSDEIKVAILKLRYRRISSEKECLNNLREIMALKFKFINFKPDFLKLFKGFVENIYEKEFFSKINGIIQRSESKKSDLPVAEIKSNNNEEATEAKFIFEDSLLDDPSVSIHYIYGLGGLEKKKSIDFISETYSNFIDENFNESIPNLKNLICKSIGETLK